MIHPMINKNLLILLLLFFFKQTIAQKYIDRWYNEEHLPQNSVLSIAKDEFGFIWLATESGLARFDGVNFKSFNDFNQLTTNRFYYLFTYNDSLYAKNIQQEDVLIQDRKPLPLDFKHLDPGKRPYKISPFEEFHTKVFEDRKNQQIFKNDTLSITIDYNYSLKIQTKEVSEVIDFDQPISSIVKYENSLFILSKESIYLLSLEDLNLTKVLTQEKLDKYIENPNKKQTSLYYLYAQTEKTIFINYDNYVFTYSLQDNKMQLVHDNLNFKNNNIVCAFYDEENQTAYFGSGYKGLLITRKNKFKVFQSQTENYVQNLIYAFDVINEKQIITSRGLKIQEEQVENIGYHSGVVAQYMANYKDLKYFQILRNKIVLIDYANNAKMEDFLILEDDLGALYYDKDKKSLFFASRKFDKNKAVAIMRYQLYEEKLDTIYTIKDNVSFIEKIENNTLSLGTENGAYMAQLDQSSLTLIQGTEQAHVRHMNFEEDRVWISTYNAGLLLLKEDEIHKFPTIKNKVSKSVHHALEDDHGFLWISTNKGLLRSKVENLLDFSSPTNHYNIFTVNDGLPISEFNGGCQPCTKKLENGMMLFPTLNGLIKFNPADFLNLKTDLSINELEVKVNNSEAFIIQNEKQLTLGSDTERVEINIDFLRQNSVYKLKYQINNGALHTVENDKILFDNLKHGNYNIKIFYPNSKQKHLSLYIEIEPSFLESNLFKVLAIGLFALLTYLLAMLFIVVEKNRRKQLDLLINEKTKMLSDTISSLNTTTNDLEEKVKSHKKIIASISHDIKTPLQYLKLGTEFLKTELSDKNLGTDVQENIEALDDSIKKLQDFTENILAYSKAIINQDTSQREIFSISELITEKLELFKPVIKSKKINVILKVSPDLKVTTNKNLLAVIIHNVLDNALKNTDKESVTIAAKLMMNKFILKIEDKGAGMDENTLRKYRQVFKSINKKVQVSGSGLGLFIVAESSRLINAEIEIESNKNKGTSFILTINQ
ncbi:MAG: hypothetical protein LAT51_04670 [Flavobacteriaceae bacterium]|nr:hypothetical protein [Flavobacteriaceae bacterium]